MTAENYRYTVDAIKDTFKFAWEHRHRGKNIVVVSIWGSIALALIGTYSWAVNADSNGNWDWSISTAELGWCEVVFFLVTSITVLGILYIINRTENISQKDVKAILQKEDENHLILARLESRDSSVIKHLLPNLRDAIKDLKVVTAYSYLTEIKKEALIYYKQDYDLLSSIEYNLGQCARYIHGKDCNKHYKEAYNLMKKAGNDDVEIVEAMVYIGCKSKDYAQAKKYADELKRLDESSIWCVVPDLLVAENIDDAVNQIPTYIDVRLAIATAIMMGVAKDKGFGVDIDTYEYSELTVLTTNNFALWVLDMSVALTRFVRSFAIQSNIELMRTKQCIKCYQIVNAYLKALSNTELENLMPDSVFVNALTGYIQDQDPKRIETAKSAKHTDNMEEVYCLGLSFMLKHANRVEEGLAVLQNYNGDTLSSILNMRLNLALSIMDNSEILSVFEEASKSQCLIPDHFLNLFLGTVRGYEDEKIREYALTLNFENPISKRFTVEYVHFLRGEEVDVEWMQTNESKFDALLIPYAACVYKDKIGLNVAVEKLTTCIDRRVLDLRTRLLIDFMSEDRSYRKELYHLLKDLRHGAKSIKDYEPQLMAMELQMSEQIPDYANSLELTKGLLQLLPDNANIVVHHLMALAGKGGCQDEIKCYEDFLIKSRLQNTEINIIVNIYQSIGEDAFAVEYLYQQIKRTNDQTLKDLYVSKHLNPAFDAIISQEKDVVEISDIVKIDIDGEEKEVVVSSGSIYDELVGKKKGDECILTIRDEGTVKICSIRNKYYKLICDIYQELKDSNSSKSIKMFSTEDFDFDNDPLGALAKMSGRTDEIIAEERKAIKQYKHAEAPLSAFIKYPGTFADIYDKIYGSFMVCTHPNSQMVKAFEKAGIDLNEQRVVLDITSLIVLHEFDLKYGLKYDKKFYITNGLENYLTAEIMNEEKGSFTFFSDALKEKISISITDSTMTALWNKLKMLEEWITKRCEVVVVEEKLNLDLDRELGILTALSMEAMLLSKQGYILLSEDWGSILHYIKFAPSMSVYNWLCMTGKDHAFDYGLFMLDNGNVGYDMTAEYINQQYCLLAGGSANSYNTCVENISYLPESPEIVVGASKLMLNGLVGGAKTMAVTNLLVTLFKVLRQETAMHLINREFQYHSDVVYRQCLIDACRIAYPIIMA